MKTRACLGFPATHALLVGVAMAAAPFHFDVTTDPHMGTTNGAVAISAEKAPPDKRSGHHEKQLVQIF